MPKHNLYSYRLDDWLVIRTDMAGHESVVNTEMWYHWNDEEANFIDVLNQARRLPESSWLGCEGGWCGKCERESNIFGDYSGAQLLDQSSWERDPFLFLDKDDPTRSRHYS